MREKHRNDKNHGRSGWVGGNPRYGKGYGNFKGLRPKDKAQARQTIKQETER